MINAVNILLILICLIIIPVLLGLFAVPMFSDGNRKGTMLSACYSFGLIFMLGTFQLAAVPLVALKSSFHVLFYSWVAIVILLCILSVILNRKYVIKAFSSKNNYKPDSLTVCIFVAFLAVVIFETWLLAFHMHTDTDDVRFISEALEAYENDTMLMYHPITGSFLGGAMGEMTKELSSPYPFFIAAVSKFINITPAATAHVIFPLFLIPAFYMTMCLIGRFFFGTREKEVAVFLFLLSIIILFSFESVYALGYTLLTIIWQGRSVLATIVLPALWLMLMKNMEEETDIRHVAVTVLTYLACADLSGMGLVSSICLGGVYFLVTLIAKKSVRKASVMLVMMIPTVILFGYYLYVYKMFG